MKSHLLPSTINCPACGTGLVGALNTTSDNPPQDGDATLCAVCRALLVYSGTPVVNSLRYPTDDEQRRFLSDIDVQRAIAALAEAHRQRLI